MNGSAISQQYRRWIFAVTMAVLLPMGPAWAGKSFDIPAQDLAVALEAFAKQADKEVLFDRQQATGKQSVTVKGELDPASALRALMGGNGLSIRRVNERTFVIGDVRPAGKGVTLARAGRAQDMQPIAAHRVAGEGEGAATTGTQDARDANAAITSTKGIPEMLVEGQRSSNSDIRRTEDDVQPYVVFDAEEIESSMASDIESFLRARLPMNQQSYTVSMTDGQRGGQSTIDLRGLGSEETLILVNGRRLPSIADPISSRRFQPDINGIPLSSIERIEILPSTAGGIYGGSATGGVVNVILKRGYQGLEVRATYDGTTNGGNTRRRLEASGGLSLEGGRTSLNFNASYSDATPLVVGDRDFNQRARERILQNDPESLLFRSFNGPISGYTTNIQSASGNPLVLESNGQSLGSARVSVPVGYAGPDSDGGLAFLQTAGSFNTDLPDTALGLANGLKKLVLSNPTVRSVALSVRREFTDRIEAFADLSNYDNRSQSVYGAGTGIDAGTLPAGAAGNPFTEAVRYSAPITGIPDERLLRRSWSESRALVGGVIVRLPRNWSVHGEYNWSRSQSGYRSNGRTLISSAPAAVQAGALDVFRDLNAYPLDLTPYLSPTSPQNNAYSENVMKNATLRLTGPVWTLPGGSLMLSSLLERRDEVASPYVTTLYSQNGAASYYYTPEIAVNTDSAYMELTLPLISAKNNRPGIMGLELQVSYRHDKTTVPSIDSTSYATFLPSPEGPYPQPDITDVIVNASQYTFGVRYQPVEQLALRASYGEGVLPPSLNNLAPRLLPATVVPFLGSRLRDPKRGGEPLLSLAQYSALGSPNLRAEQSESISAGLILTPASIPGLRVSVDYTRIDKVDEITAINDQVLIDLEDQGFSGRITRGELTAADQALGYTVGPITGLDDGAVNIASSFVEAFDVQADYTWKTAYGEFKASAIGTVQPHLQQQILSDQPTLEKVGYNLGPLKVRGNVGLTWTRAAWSLGWNMQYYDSYLIYDSGGSESFNAQRVARNGSPTVPSQIYHDLFGRYRFGGKHGSGWSGLLNNVEVLASVRNVLDTNPPILTDNGLGFFQMSPYGDPRLRSYAITLSKSFQ